MTNNRGKNSNNRRKNIDKNSIEQKLTEKELIKAAKSFYKTTYPALRKLAKE